MDVHDACLRRDLHDDGPGGEGDQHGQEGDLPVILQDGMELEDARADGKARPGHLADDDEGGFDQFLDEQPHQLQNGPQPPAVKRNGKKAAQEKDDDHAHQIPDGKRVDVPSVVQQHPDAGDQQVQQNLQRHVGSTSFSRHRMPAPSTASMYTDGLSSVPTAGSSQSSTAPDPMPRPRDRAASTRPGSTAFRPVACCSPSFSSVSPQKLRMNTLSSE